MNIGLINDEEIKGGIFSKTLESWESFVDFVKDPKQSWGTLIYRGQANSIWPVVSTLDRLEKRFPTTPNIEKDIEDYYKCPRVGRERLLDRFKEMARGRLLSPIPEDKQDEWWALAQHYGMATPMLDWTYSPFVALYFAFNEEKCRNQIPKNRAIFALTHHLIPSEQEVVSEEEQKHPKPFAPTWPGNHRLTNQAGLFLKMPIGINLESYISKQFKADTYELPQNGRDGNLHPQLALVKFIIPNGKKERFKCLRFLDHMNINRASLFPDLDGAAKYVNDLWEINWDKAIGFINDKSCRPSATSSRKRANK
jgi:FRG domain-containing protein